MRLKHNLNLWGRADVNEVVAVSEANCFFKKKIFKIFYPKKPWQKYWEDCCCCYYKFQAFIWQSKK